METSAIPENRIKIHHTPIGDNENTVETICVMPKLKTVIPINYPFKTRILSSCQNNNSSRGSSSSNNNTRVQTYFRPQRTVGYSELDDFKTAIENSEELNVTIYSIQDGPDDKRDDGKAETPDGISSVNDRVIIRRRPRGTYKKRQKHDGTTVGGKVREKRDSSRRSRDPSRPKIKKIAAPNFEQFDEISNISPDELIKRLAIKHTVAKTSEELRKEAFELKQLKDKENRDSNAAQSPDSVESSAENGIYNKSLVDSDYGIVGIEAYSPEMILEMQQVKKGRKIRKNYVLPPEPASGSSEIKKWKAARLYLLNPGRTSLREVCKQNNVSVPTLITYMDATRVARSLMTGKYSGSSVIRDSTLNNRGKNKYPKEVREQHLQRAYEKLNEARKKAFQVHKKEVGESNLKLESPSEEHLVGEPPSTPTDDLERTSFSSTPASASTSGTTVVGFPNTGEENCEYKDTKIKSDFPGERCHVLTLGNTPVKEAKDAKEGSQIGVRFDQYEGVPMENVSLRLEPKRKYTTVIKKIKPRVRKPATVRTDKKKNKKLKLDKDSVLSLSSASAASAEMVKEFKILKFDSNNIPEFEHGANAAT